MEEAERRGLPNITNTVDAAEAIISEKTIAMYEKQNVFSKTELESRYEIVLEGYANTIRIEARAMIDMASRLIIPAVIDYRAFLADTIRSLREAGSDTTVECKSISRRPLVWFFSGAVASPGFLLVSFFLQCNP